MSTIDYGCLTGYREGAPCATLTLRDEAEPQAFIDEVTGEVFCQLHAGPLAWDKLTVDRYSMALRVAGHCDVPLALPKVEARAA